MLRMRQDSDVIDRSSKLDLKGRFATPQSSLRSLSIIVYVSSHLLHYECPRCR
jgi:hypothetical protein